MYLGIFFLCLQITNALEDGQLYTISFYNQGEYYQGIDKRQACAGRYLSYKIGGEGYPEQLSLEISGPRFPLVVWRAEAVEGSPEEFTFVSVNRSSEAPAQLSYSLNCSNTGVFLGRPGASGNGNKWILVGRKRSLIAVSRNCSEANGSEVMAPLTFTANSSCSGPTKNGVKLYPGKKVNKFTAWDVVPFYSYPAFLIGVRTPVGDDVLSTGDPEAVTSSDGFGQSVSISGNLLAVGEWGGAYAFLRHQDSQWGQWTRYTLKHPPWANNRTFGFAVAAADEYIVCGSPGHPDIGSKKAGVLVYRPAGNNATKWSEKPVVLSKPKDASLAFGSSVAAYKNAIAVADPGLWAYIYDSELGQEKYDPGKGNVYIYKYENEKWSSPKAVLNIRLPGFGKSVALDETTLVVGGYKKTRILSLLSSNNTWKMQATLPLEGSVQYQGDTVAGPPLSDSMYPHQFFTSSDIYTRNISNGSWSRTQTLNFTGREVNFGVRAIQGNLLLAAASVGTPSEPYVHPKYEVYAFMRDTQTGLWVNYTRLISPYLPEGQFYNLGESASISKNLVVVGAKGFYGNQYAGTLFGNVNVWNRDLI